MTEIKHLEKNRIESVQVLRAICSLLVILVHTGMIDTHVAFTVDIFFVISGFMIAMSTNKSTDHFLLKRLLRIIPLYYLMTFVTYVAMIIFPTMFQQVQVNNLFLLKSLLFIPFEIVGGGSTTFNENWLDGQL